MAIKSWSTTAGDNDDADATINWLENQAPSTVNNSARAMMAAIRAWYEDVEFRDWGHTVTRTGNTTFTIAADVTLLYLQDRPIRCADSSTLYGYVASSSYSAPNTTVTVTLDSGNLSASLTAVALGPDPSKQSISVKSIRNGSSPLLGANNTFTGNNTLSGTNTHSGANTFTSSVAVTTTGTSNTVSVTSTDAGAAVWPAIVLDRNSATPAASDVLESIDFSGRDSGGGTDVYARVQGEIVDHTAASEDGKLAIATAVAGTLATRAYVAQGLVVGSPDGGDKGTGSGNFGSLYVGGTAVAIPSNSIAIIKNGGVNLAQNSTLYLRPVGQEGDNTSESNTRIQIRRPTTVSGLRGVLSAAVPASNSIVVTLRKNGADTALTFTISASGTTGSDATNSVDFDTGDWLAVKAVTSATFGTTNDINVTAVCKTPGTDYASPVHGFGNMGFGSAGYLGEPGGDQFGTESHGQVPLKKSVIGRFYMTDGTAAPSITLRRNAAAVSPALTGNITDGAIYTAGQADTDAHVYAANDLLTITQDTGGGSANGTLVFFNEFNPYDIYAPTFFASQGQTQNTTRYMGGWNLGSASATEADVNIPMPACTVRNLRVHSSAAPPAGQTCVVTVRKNGSDTALTATISDSGTTFADTSNSVTFAAGDLLSIKSVSSATAGTLSYTASLELTTS